MSAVRVKGLTVRYGPPGTAPAVDNVDLTADAGEVLVVLGPNGAGKTSTVETLEGYRRPASGEVRVLGLDPAVDHAALTGRMGVMLQSGGVYPMLGPRRVLDLFASYYPEPIATDELLDLVGLRRAAATPFRHLSGGEQRRLSLALALIGRPEVAFLDEPTSGVDPEGRIEIRGVVAGLAERGVAVVLTTHELAEAERMAHRIVILAGGRVVREGTAGELTGPADNAATTVVTFGAPPGLDTAELAAAVGAGTRVTEAGTAPGRYLVETNDLPGPAVAAAVTAHLAARGAALTDLVVGRTLEDVYLAAVGPDAAAPSASASDATETDGPTRRRRRSRR
ncbi:MAG TPA: ABC transporter ATP-binding protein [Acidimicrobiales bacterium]|nr:ABC transporter ATP-binding protein [Acidimicrobiales bacterium]